MPKCNNCKKSFEAYSLEATKLPVIDRAPLEVMKLNCPVCGSMQHLLQAPPVATNSSYQVSMP